MELNGQLQTPAASPLHKEWMDPKASLDITHRDKSYPCQELNPDHTSHSHQCY